MAGRRDVWNALNRLKAALAASSGGAVGNAAAADVVSGKTFSSATAGTGVSGTNTKNATVPNDAPIQPPQAFVDTLTKVDQFGNLALAQMGEGNLYFEGVGITSISSDFLDQFLAAALTANLSVTTTLDFSANAITESSVNAILASCVNSGATNGTLDLSGGTNAAPSGQGTTDKNTLISNGWTVTTN